MKILFKSLLLTIATLILTFLTSRLSETKIFKLVFPETTALEEFEITDVAFKNRKNPEINQEIVIVNTSFLERRELAEQIRIISKHKPRVIAIDNIFNAKWNEAQFATESRLYNEAAPVNELHFTPGNPFMIRARFSVFF